MRIRTLPKQGFTNLTIGRDLYTQLTVGARTHGNLGIPNYLSRLLSGQMGSSTVLRTEEVKSEVPFSRMGESGPGGIRTHDLRTLNLIGLLHRIWYHTIRYKHMVP